MRRSWLFVPGADPDAHRRAARSGADVIILELEDFTPPELRPRARALARKAFEKWRKAGAVAAVRVNPLEGDGLIDLESVLPGKPDIVLMSKVATPEHVRALEQATGAAVELVPNIESAAGPHFQRRKWSNRGCPMGKKDGVQGQESCRSGSRNCDQPGIDRK